MQRPASTCANGPWAGQLTPGLLCFCYHLYRCTCQQNFPNWSLQDSFLVYFLKNVWIWERNISFFVVVPLIHTSLDWFLYLCILNRDQTHNLVAGWCSNPAIATFWNSETRSSDHWLATAALAYWATQPVHELLHQLSRGCLYGIAASLNSKLCTGLSNSIMWRIREVYATCQLKVDQQFLIKCKPKKTHSF